MDGRGKAQAVALVIVASGALIAIGTLLPWSEFEASATGVEPIADNQTGVFLTEGKIALGAGIGLGLVGLVGLLQPRFRVWIALLTIIGAVAAGWMTIKAYSAIEGIEQSDVSADFPGITASFEVGFGVWLALVGAIVALVAGLGRLTIQTSVGPRPGGR